MRRAEYRLLGPLEVVKDGAPIALGRRQQRALLAILLLQPGSVVSTDRLVELLWPGTTPGRPKTAIQGYVSGLRKALGPEAILTRGGGYLLDAEWEQLDAARFKQLLTEAGAALARDEPETARGSLVQALALWRGSALSDFAYESWAQNEVGRLDELRLVAREHLIQARLALGEHAELVGELDAFVEEQPLRERARAQLMLALYRSGRQAEAPRDVPPGPGEARRGARARAEPRASGAPSGHPETGSRAGAADAGAYGGRRARACSTAGSSGCLHRPGDGAARHHRAPVQA
jgi:DNA-binding SARP family transcriptional activator